MEAKVSISFFPKLITGYTMYKLLKLPLLLSLFTLSTHSQSANIQVEQNERGKLNMSMIISGGVSLGAYEAGYNWAMIKMLSEIRDNGKLIEPDLRSVAGASAGSINALLSAMYWCQKESVPLHNSVDDNLFYETWVNLGIEDLAIEGKDPTNKNSLFTRRGLEKKGEIIIDHLKKPIFRKGCEVPLGVSVTKVRPIVETISGIKVKNQNFSVPLVFKEKNGQGIVENKELPKSTAFYISIPGTITFKNARSLQELVRSIPLDRILLETDSPFLAPMPFRGKRNEPSYVRYVADKIAKLKKLDFEEVASVTSQNVKTLFRIPT